jgi:hypothetical protein
LSVDGIQVVWPRMLVKRMAEAPPQELDVVSVHERLASAFPSA